MSEVETPTTEQITTPPTETPVAPAAFEVPEGKVLLDQREADILRRQGESAKGASKLISQMREAGFDTPEEFVAEFKGFKSEIEKAGLDFKGVLERIKAPQQYAPAPTPPEAPEQEAEVLSKAEIRRMVDEGVATNLVLADHQRAQQAAKQSIDGIITTLAKDADPDAKAAIQAIVRELSDTALRESFYPEDHALGDKQFKPLDAEAIKGISQKAISLVGKFGGLKLAGDPAASKPATALPARPGYKQTASGAPNPGSSGQRRSLEEVTADAVRRAQARMGD